MSGGYFMRMNVFGGDGGVAGSTTPGEGVMCHVRVCFANFGVLVKLVGQCRCALGSVSHVERREREGVDNAATVFRVRTCTGRCWCDE